MLEQAQYPTNLPNSANHLHGELIRPNHRSYDVARKVWNGMVDKYPALIVRCADQAEWSALFALLRVNTCLQPCAVADIASPAVPPAMEV